MSREIKFRGWHKGLNKWVYGFLTRNKNGVYFIENADNVYGIADEKSVGQYTGLKDKHGMEIFEGDIVQFKSIRDIIERYEVEYTNYGEWAIGMHRLSMRFRSCEVIGNVHEHSHLLEETA